ncbi:Fic family protein [Patulibacter sp. S7RM1-6]
MDLERLRTSPIGALVPLRIPDPLTRETVDGHAYLPEPLPQDVELSTGTWTTVNRATAALARLDGTARLIPNPGLLRRPALRREAQSTSALEGTYAPIADVLAADQAQTDLPAALREVLNFERMAELAFSWPDDRRLTVSMLGDLQQHLVAGTAGELGDAGRIRDRIVVIGSRGRPLADARFVPPPPGDQLRAGVEALLEWIDAPPELPTVVLAAMAHYQFETLHPYSDGNGRLGRLLVIVQLLRGAIIREPLLVVSPWFEARRNAYQDELLDLSCTGDWDRWIAFFAEGVAASAEESRSKVEGLLALQEELRVRVHEAGRRGAAERLAADLVGRPFVSRPEVARLYGLSGQGAANAIAALQAIGILEPTGARTTAGADIFRAPRVMDVLTA